MPGMAGGIEIPGVGTFSGHSYKSTAWERLPLNQRPVWTPDYDVLRLYDRVPSNMRSVNRAKCAETLALSKIFAELKGKGYSGAQIEGMLRGGKSSAVVVKTGESAAPCNSCRFVLEGLGILF